MFIEVVDADDARRPSSELFDFDCRSSFVDDDQTAEHAWCRATPEQVVDQSPPSVPGMPKLAPRHSRPATLLKRLFNPSEALFDGSRTSTSATGPALRWSAANRYPRGSSPVWRP